jgi:hypothetical protein
MHHIAWFAIVTIFAVAAFATSNPTQAGMVNKDAPSASPVI